MTEMVPSGLMRGHWRRSDGDAYTGTKLETAETAKVHLPTTAPVLYSTHSLLSVSRGCGTGSASPFATVREVWADAASREDAARGVWALGAAETT
jgi:hypothetical protein